MVERLSDEDLDRVERLIESDDLSTDDLIDMTRDASLMLAELRALRAQALSDEEREALALALKHLDCSTWMIHQRHDPIVSKHIDDCERASAAIRKLLAAGGAR